MLKATHMLSNLEKHQMQQILHLYDTKQELLEEHLNIIEQEKDYVMEPYYLYHQDNRVTGFILIEFVVDGLLQAKIYVENKGMIDSILQQFKNYLICFGIETALFCMEEELDSNEVQSLLLSTCEYQMICGYDDFFNWASRKKGTKARLRWLTSEDETFYKRTLEKTFFMEFEEREERFLSLKDDMESIKNDGFLKENCMAGVILELADGEKIGIGGCYIGRQCITLFDLAVLENYQGQGFGSELLYFIFTTTQNLKKDYLLQVSSDSKRAVALYQSIGFKVQEQLYCYKLAL